MPTKLKKARPAPRNPSVGSAQFELSARLRVEAWGREPTVKDVVDAVEAVLLIARGTNVRMAGGYNVRIAQAERLSVKRPAREPRKLTAKKLNQQRLEEASTSGALGEVFGELFGSELRPPKKTGGRRG